MKKKSISDYLTNWHKAIIALVFFISAGIWVMALAGEVKQNSKDIEQTQESVEYMQLEYQKTSKENRLYRIQEGYECEDLTFTSCVIPIPKIVKEEIKKLQKEIENKEKRMEKLEAK